MCDAAQSFARGDIHLPIDGERDAAIVGGCGNEFDDGLNVERAQQRINRLAQFLGQRLVQGFEESGGVPFEQSLCGVRNYVARGLFAIRRGTLRGGRPCQGDK
jgi:hypothetical protein